MWSHPIFAPQGLGKDMLAGLVVFLVAVPTSLGIAESLDVPLAAGIVAGLVGGILIGALSGSSTSVSGPSPGLIGVLLFQLAVLPSFEAMLLAVVIAGLLQIGFGLARVGYLSAFIPTGVVKGLIAALGIILILKQIPHIFGHDTNPEGEMSFWQPDRETTFSELLELTGDYHIGATFVGILSVAIMMFWQMRRPKWFGFLPAGIFVVLFGAVMQLLFKQLGGPWEIGHDHLLQVPTWGTPEGLGALVTSPDFTFLNDRRVYFAGVVIAIVASLETMLNLQAVDQIDKERRRSPVNRELIAQGIGNTTSGLLGGLPITSLVIHSSVNIQNDGRTKRAAIFHGLFFFVFVALFPSVLNLIPLSALAAILLVTGIELASPQLFRRMWDEGRTQFIPFIVTLLAIVFTDLLIGSLIGLVISVAFILHSNMRSPLRRIVEKHLNNDVLHIELANQVSFLNRGVLDKTLTEIPDGSHVMLDATSTQYIDPDILTLIKEFRDFVAPRHNIKLSLKGFGGDHELEDHIQYVDYSSRELQTEITPEQVLNILREGNERFRTGKRLPRDIHAQIHGSSIGQFPLAVVLSCIDSRTPVELVFDLGLGDVFSVRLAGNVVGPKSLGSLEYSTAVAGAKLILVVGHTSCGAVNAAVKFAYANPTCEEVTGCENIAAIVNRIRMSITREDWEANLSKGPEEQRAFADQVSRANVIRVLHDIIEQSGTIRRLVDQRKIALVGAMYDVASAEIEFFMDEAIGLEFVVPASAGN
jgi:carbonic anhydrase/SulP family sulfate permease